MESPSTAWYKTKLTQPTLISCARGLTVTPSMASYLQYYYCSILCFTLSFVWLMRVVLLASPSGVNCGVSRRLVGAVSSPVIDLNSSLSMTRARYPWRHPHFVVFAEAASFAHFCSRWFTVVLVCWPTIQARGIVAIFARTASRMAASLDVDYSMVAIFARC